MPASPDSRPYHRYRGIVLTSKRPQVDEWYLAAVSNFINSNTFRCTKDQSNGRTCVHSDNYTLTESDVRNIQFVDTLETDPSESKLPVRNAAIAERLGMPTASVLVLQQQTDQGTIWHLLG